RQYAALGQHPLHQPALRRVSRSELREQPRKKRRLDGEGALARHGRRRRGWLAASMLGPPGLRGGPECRCKPARERTWRPIAQQGGDRRYRLIRAIEVAGGEFPPYLAEQFAESAAFLL